MSRFSGNVVQGRVASTLSGTDKSPTFNLRSCLRDLLAKLLRHLHDYSLRLPPRVLSRRYLLQPPHLSLHVQEVYMRLMIDLFFQTLVHLPVVFPYPMRTGLKILIRVHSPISQEPKLARSLASPLFPHLPPIPRMTPQPRGQAKPVCNLHQRGQ